MNKKIVVGISGGVDSAVAAYLLKEQGYDVIGVFFVMWKNKDGSIPECITTSLNDAKNVANTLNISLEVVDASVSFRNKVIDYFASEYMNGRTPNPCVICNRHIKFEWLLNIAREKFNAQLIATGHYAKIIYDEKNGRYALQNALSDTKDQTYALFNLSQEQLRHIVFPIGKFEKAEVRKIAEDADLVVAKKNDSQEICFIPDNNYAKYICENYNYKIVNGEFIYKGKPIGTHKGIIHYTVGQRRGLGLSLVKPLYVKSIDVKNNQVLLETDDELFAKSITVNDVNWMSVEKIEPNTKAQVKIRYSAQKQTATLSMLEDNKVYVVFDKPVKSVTPGQAAVFYINDVVIGGGFIQ